MDLYLDGFMITRLTVVVESLCLTEEYHTVLLSHTSTVQQYIIPSSNLIMAISQKTMQDILMI